MAQHKRVRRISAWHFVVPIAAVAAFTSGFTFHGDRVVTNSIRVPVYTTSTRTSTATVTTTRTTTATTTRTARPAARSASRTAARTYAPGTAQSIAKELLAARGWSGQWTCLNNLVNRESGWNVYARNPSSGAYGIPQSLPATKMASAGADWRTNPRTQLIWMMGYIKDRYSTPCGAWAHSQKTGWY